MRPLRPALLAVAAALLLAGCSSSSTPAAGRSASSSGAADPVSARPPALGSCRLLGPAQVEEKADPTQPRPCTEEHTAETFAVGAFPERFADAAYDDPRLGGYVYRVCQPASVRFLGGDESAAMRTVLGWAWFRPSEGAWDRGARWYRCDLVGGPSGATSYRPLPRTARGLLGGRPPEDWVLCARGRTVTGSAKVPCAQPHQWRAVTTIRLGGARDRYPGDRLAQVRSRQYCSDSVGAWLSYPATDYDYGVTVFHEAEWKAGNRRSICWARTTR